MMELGIFLLVSTVAAVVGWRLAGRRSQRAVASARLKAQRLAQDAAGAAAIALREGEARCRVLRVQIDQMAESQRQEIAEEIRLLGDLLERKEARVALREQQLGVRGELIDGRDTALQELKQQARQVRDEAKEARRGCRQAIEQQAGMTAAEAAERMVEQLVEDTRGQCADRLRNLEATGAEEFGRQAKRVMGIVMQRYSGHCVRERAAMTMALAEGVAAKLQAVPALVGAIGTLVKVDLSFADDGSSVRLDSGDGVAREICRRALARVVSNPEQHDAAALVESVRSELTREIVHSGRAAARQLGIEAVAPEIVELVGRLNYRTSYTQNQYRHALEAGQLAGMMAQELGLEPATARRAALMHDVGKALTHEIEGSHALIGADIARRSGESELVANAIGFHHGEEPPLSAYAPLVAAADAMSGGRPGARREMVESYGDRIGDLEQIAGEFVGVMRAHAVQAGRELRVHVDESRVTDDDLPRLSSAIAAKISDELTFPGQIRVTVIREFCAVDYAS